MILKSLLLQGFKSFPDKTEIRFSGGMTAIVGPNGSGKSNISDALRWVLGEQSSRMLRGAKMEDVIFGGTSKRAPLGFAEVSLILDNSTGIFQSEHTEIMVTRRYYRSGESEYYLNKKHCRLKDIKEMTPTSFKEEWGFARTAFIDSADSGTIMEARKMKNKIHCIYNFEPSWKKTKNITRIQLEQSWQSTLDFLILDECTDYLQESDVYSWDENNQPEDKNDHHRQGCQYAWLPYKKKIGNWETIKQIIKDADKDE